MRSALLIVIVLIACNKEARESSTTTGELSATEFKSRLDESVVLLDVRTPEEFATGYIPGAVNLDFKSSDFQSKLDSMDKSKVYMVYCAAGVRSGKASKVMKDLGFASVSTLEGGLEAWTAEGFPLGKDSGD